MCESNELPQGITRQDPETGRILICGYCPICGEYSEIDPETGEYIYGTDCRH